MLLNLVFLTGHLDQIGQGRVRLMAELALHVIVHEHLSVGRPVSRLRRIKGKGIHWPKRIELRNKRLKVLFKSRDQRLDRWRVRI